MQFQSIAGFLFLPFKLWGGHNFHLRLALTKAIRNAAGYAATNKIVHKMSSNVDGL